MIFLDRNRNCVYIMEKGGNTMTKSFNVIIEKDEDGFFVATVPSLRGCHTQAKSLDKLMERTKEAIELCLEVEEDSSENEFIGVQRLAVSV
ncbi:MAG: type II toxin-antitoxin system HicB family antitoxin [Victivallales bacterium]